MPRNSSGTYTLPSGNPVTSGTLIEASWANSTLSDLASAMTDSLSRDGEGGMTAALRLYDGDVSLPGLAFTNETSTGLYHAGAGDMRLAITGSQVMQFLATGVAVTGTLSATGAVSLTGQTMTMENATAYYPQLINRNKTNDANGAYIAIEKIRNTSIVQNGDVLGNFIFRGYDGAAYLQGAFINAVVSGTPGTNDMPTDLVFGTTSDGGAGPTERLRISNTGAGTASADWTINGVRVGQGAGAVNTNTAVGASALQANTSGAYSVAIGYQASYTSSTGQENVAVGYGALYSNTVGSNTAVGSNTLNANSTGTQNSAFGKATLNANTTGSYNTGVGGGALQSNTTASYNTAVGYLAGYAVTTGDYNTYLGGTAAQGATTGTRNTFIGYGSGNAITTGDRTTILGRYNGNQGGLDIRTSSNYIVLSDGDGNPRMYSSGANDWWLNSNSGDSNLNFNVAGSAYKAIINWSNSTTRLYISNTSAGVYLASGGTSWTSASDERFKTDLTPIENAAAKVATLRSVTGRYITDEEGVSRSFLIAQDIQAVLPEAVDASDPEKLGVQYTDVIPLLVAAIKELKAEFDAYKATHP